MTIIDLLKKYSDFMDSFTIEKEQNVNNYVMYIIINGGLKMKKGKIASQVGHAVHQITEICLKTRKKLWKKYNLNSCPKIVLRTKDQDELLEIIEKTESLYKTYVIDEGRIQTPPNSLTVIAYVPMIKDYTPKIIQKLNSL
tara:strand:+ start:229 stop:651 length:423 start_codon:yes stop_codon:yes gene_type:complete